MSIETDPFLSPAAWVCADFVGAVRVRSFRQEFLCVPNVGIQDEANDLCARGPQTPNWMAHNQVV